MKIKFYKIRYQSDNKSVAGRVHDNIICRLEARVRATNHESERLKRRGRQGFRRGEGREQGTRDIETERGGKSKDFHQGRGQKYTGKTGDGRTKNTSLYFIPSFCIK